MRVELSFTDDRATQTEHWDLLYKVWERLGHLRQHDIVTLDGKSLDIASVVAVAR